MSPTEPRRSCPDQLVDHALATLRDPREALANRLAARKRLLDRRSLSRKEDAVVRSYDRVLAHLLGRRELVVCGVRYWSTGDALDEGKP